MNHVTKLTLSGWDFVCSRIHPCSGGKVVNVQMVSPNNFVVVCEGSDYQGNLVLEARHYGQDFEGRFLCDLGDKFIFWRQE